MPEPSPTSPRELLRSAYHLWLYARHLSNGVDVWRHRRAPATMPPLHFRDGMIWHHGPRDEPLFILREIYSQSLYAPLPAGTHGHVLDIGANIGAVTMFWAKDQPDLTIHAYEPNPQAGAALLRNIQANGLGGRVRVHNEAVGRIAGTLDLWTDVPTAHASAYGPSPAAGGRRISVPAVSLDDAWQRIGRQPVEMLKIDVEGGEVDILDGASEPMLAAVRTAIVEYHDNLVPGAYARCRARLDAAGFACRVHPHPWDEGIIYATR